jgi:hypothetical protein
MNSPSSSSSSSSPHARVIVLGAAALDLLAPRGGGGGASSSDDASMMMQSNTVKDAFFAFPILVFPAKENASKSCARKRAVEKLFRCALDGVQRALSRKKSSGSSDGLVGGGANYLGAAHASHGGEVVHAWLTASRTVLLLAVLSESEADEDEEFVVRTFRAMERELTRARMNPFGGNGGGFSDEREDEGGRLERCRRAIANACKV